MTGEEFLAKLASLPLLHQPGTVWDYSLSTDVLGLLLEATTGRKLGQFLHERLWQPLQMTDTGFSVPHSKRNRVAQPLPTNPDTGRPQSISVAAKPIKFDCGGACAVSTAGDYVRFAQMLLNKGRLGDARILSRNTVEYMTANHLGPEIENRLPRDFRLLGGYGFGLGVAVRGQAGVAAINGSVGDYSWTGAFGTRFWVDPKEQLVVVFMSQAFQPINGHNGQLLAALVYQAIAD
jgi:CubicO group peptidase (beta-lactamase class C family)